MSLSYTTGNPSNLTAGATASMTDISGPFTDIKTWADAKFSSADLTTATNQTLGLNSGSQVGRGALNIVATESRTNVAFGTLTTADQVAGIVLPTNGLIAVSYTATWQESVVGAASAAIFVGANQLKRADANVAAPAVQAAAVNNSGGVANTDKPLTTYGNGLICNSTNSIAYTGDVTTGQTIGLAGPTDTPSPCYIFAAAGTYTISVQFKSTSGSVTAKNRTLRVWVVGF